MENKKNAVIFDTETNGKIKDWNLPLNKTTLDNFPRITQLAWQKVCLLTGDVLSEHESIIYPDGWTVPEEQFFIDNNMSTERCLKEGRPLVEVLPLIVADLQDSEIVVAHNLNFDMKVIGAEMIRYQIKVGKELIKVCTMQESIDLCKLPPFRYGSYKFPKLVELYFFLFGKEMEGNHDAFDDVIGCRDCFLQLIELNKINLDI